jgi:tRNA pseudouridine38-40 synthase
MAERNIRLTIEYFGPAFSGWQIQKDQTSVQGEITEAIRKTTGEEVNLVGAGRTDAGVHARGQVANFRIDHRLEPERYRDALNFHLPDDIRILEAMEAPFEFHARFDATHRRYRYLISEEPSALYRHFRWHQERLDLALLHQAAELVLGEHDFSPFCVVASRKENNVCQIAHSKWRKVGPLLVYEIRGNRFLHGMVRSLVGAMANLAREKTDRNPENLTLAVFEDMLRAPGDRRVPFTAPAHGLYLVSVGY